MITLLLHLLRLLRFLLAGHRELALENLALRHQVAVYKRIVTRPRLRRIDRFFWVGSGWLGSGPGGDGLSSSSPPTPYCGGSAAASASIGPRSPAGPPAVARPSQPK